MTKITHTAALVTTLGIAGTAALAQDCDPTEIAKLLAADGADGDRFGRAVAIDGDTAVVGVTGDDDHGNASGSAYIFTRSGGVWTQQAKLVPDDGVEYAYFGYSVAIDGDTVVIGAVWDDDNGPYSGSAYVFVRDGGDWSQQAKLLQPNGTEEDWFGQSVSVSGDHAIVGAPYSSDHFGTPSGTAWAFRRSAGIWSSGSMLLPSFWFTDAYDDFGGSVWIDGNLAVIGAPGDDDNGSGSGAVYVFEYVDFLYQWFDFAKLVPDDGAEGDRFGVSACLSADTVVVGSYRDDDNGTDSGSAYVFTGSGSQWTQQAKLLPSDGIGDEWFGRTVSFSQETAVIGVEAYHSGGVGSAYVFARDAGVWSQQAKLLASDGVAGDWFGQGAAIDVDTIVLGAGGQDDNGTEAGAVYVYGLGCPDCPADLNSDGEVDTLDFLAFLGAWSAGEPLADWNGDGSVNTLDFLAYLGDWSAGC